VSTSARAVALTMLVVGCHGADRAAPTDALAEHARNGENGAELARLLLRLPASPRIDHIRAIPIRFVRSDGSEPEHVIHPQGLAWLPSAREWAVSAVEIVEQRGRDPSDPRPNGRGRGYLFFADARGRLEAARTIELASIEDDAFHPGGIDATGDAVWLSLSPYYPRSRALVAVVSFGRRGVQTRFAVEDHIGVVTLGERALFAASWDARTYYALSPSTGAVRWRAPSPDRLAVQDGQALAGTPYIVWTGPEIDGARFGLDVLRADARDALTVARAIRWQTAAHRTPSGRPPFHNAVHMWVDRKQRIWALAVADDQAGRYAPHAHGAPPDAAEAPDPEHERQGSALHLYSIH